MNVHSLRPLCYLSGLALLAAGCATTQVPVRLVSYPPAMAPTEANYALSDIDPLEIVVKATVRTNGVVSAADGTCASEMMRGAISSALGSEGFVRTVDPTIGNQKALTDLNTLVQSKRSMHGYTSFHSDTGNSAAKLEINLDVALDYALKEKTIAETLATVPYDVQWVAGKPKSIPNYVKRTTKEVTVLTRAQSLRADGNMTVVLSDKSGRKLVEKRFPLALEVVSDIDVPIPAGALLPVPGLQILPVTVGDLIPVPRHALPPVSAALLRMVESPTQQILADFFPHYGDPEALPINSAGENKSVLLLNHGALLEAVRVLDEIPSDEMTFADYENLGNAYEALGEPFSARDAYEKAVETIPLEKRATDEAARRLGTRIATINMRDQDKQEANR